MIVRIVGEDQYEVPDGHRERLNELDNAVVAAVDKGDEAGFEHCFTSLLDFVRTEGTLVPTQDSPESDVFIPFPDITLEEAREHFTGEGVVAD